MNIKAIYGHSVTKSSQVCGLGTSFAHVASATISITDSKNLTQQRFFSPKNRTPIENLTSNQDQTIFSCVQYLTSKNSTDSHYNNKLSVSKITFVNAKTLEIISTKIFENFLIKNCSFATKSSLIVCIGISMSNYRLIVFDYENNRVISNVETPDKLYHCCFSFNDKCIITVGCRHVRVWTLKNEQNDQSLIGRSTILGKNRDAEFHFVSSIRGGKSFQTFSSENILLQIGASRLIERWAEIEVGKCSSVVCLDDYTFIAGTNGRVHILRTEGLQYVTSLPLPPDEYCDKRRIVKEEEVNEEVCKFSDNFENKPDIIAMSVVKTYGYLVVYYKNGLVVIFDVSKVNENVEINDKIPIVNSFLSHIGAVTDLVCINETEFASCSFDGKVLLRQLHNSGKSQAESKSIFSYDSTLKLFISSELNTFNEEQIPNEACRVIALDDKKEFLSIGYRDGNVKIYHNMNELGKVDEFIYALDTKLHSKSVTVATFLNFPDYPPVLATGCEDGVVNLLGLSETYNDCALKMSSSISGIVFWQHPISPMMAISCTDGNVSFYRQIRSARDNTFTNWELFNTYHEADVIYDLTIDQESGHIIAATEHGGLILFDIITGKAIKSLANVNNAKKKRVVDPIGVQFSADGKFIAIRQSDYTLKILDINSRVASPRITGFGYFVTECIFLQNNKETSETLLVSSTADGCIFVIDVTEFIQIRDTKRKVTEPITPATIRLTKLEPTPPRFSEINNIEQSIDNMPSIVLEAEARNNLLKSDSISAEEEEQMKNALSQFKEKLRFEKEKKHVKNPQIKNGWLNTDVENGYLILNKTRMVRPTFGSIESVSEAIQEEEDADQVVQAVNDVLSTDIEIKQEIKEKLDEEIEETEMNINEQVNEVLDKVDNVLLKVTSKDSFEEEEEEKEEEEVETKVETQRIPEAKVLFVEHKEVGEHDVEKKIDVEKKARDELNSNEFENAINDTIKDDNNDVKPTSDVDTVPTADNDLNQDVVKTDDDINQKIEQIETTISTVSTISNVLSDVVNDVVKEDRINFESAENLRSKTPSPSPNINSPVDAQNTPVLPHSGILPDFSNSIKSFTFDEYGDDEVETDEDDDIDLGNSMLLRNTFFPSPKHATTVNSLFEKKLEKSTEELEPIKSDQAKNQSCSSENLIGDSPYDNDEEEDVEVELSDADSVQQEIQGVLGKLDGMLDVGKSDEDEDEENEEQYIFSSSYRSIKSLSNEDIDNELKNMLSEDDFNISHSHSLENTVESRKGLVNGSVETFEDSQKFFQDLENQIASVENDDVANQSLINRIEEPLNETSNVSTDDESLPGEIFDLSFEESIEILTEDKQLSDQVFAKVQTFSQSFDELMAVMNRVSQSKSTDLLMPLQKCLFSVHEQILPFVQGNSTKEEIQEKQTQEEKEEKEVEIKKKRKKEGKGE
eukprot:TRINITY_DN3193_c2_g1_i1.p1 TRINITY_DN3193_c2_g1~~TRINITY_DN3193_c2_g1_i1.p1  ORF type:complete len:1426 (+),score=456.62 TRINITY_DN3193_c2_g1_i1:53-4330(+)